MCITVTSEKKARRNFLAYKVVRKISEGKYTSISNKYFRDTQAGFCKSVKKILEYKLGKSSKSSFKDTAGIYLYKNLKTAQDAYWSSRDRVVLQVRVKQGTKCRFGEYDQLCAERIEVLKEVE